MIIAVRWQFDRWEVRAVGLCGCPDCAIVVRLCGHAVGF